MKIKQSAVSAPSSIMSPRQYFLMLWNGMKNNKNAILDKRKAQIF
jgi:hypothetical protein